jgi:superfamily II DNA/RNA helicase
MDFSDSFFGGGPSAAAEAFPSAPPRGVKRQREAGGARGGGAPAGGPSSASAPSSAAAAAGGGGGGGAAAAPRRAGKGGGFQSLGLSAPLLSSILRMGYRVPTPIQRKCLPLVLGGRDVVAMARTGSGKTAAFLIPMVERLGEHAGRGGVRAVLLSPTRELALQTLKFAKLLARSGDLRCVGLVGGEALGAQFAALGEHPDVLVATPGRLMHLLREVPGFHLRAVAFAVFDEADRLFELGFAAQLGEILGRMPEARQTLLFSATLPRALIDFAKAGLREPALVRLDVETKVSDALALAFFTVHREDKPGALLHLLRALLPGGQQAMVFVATRHHSEFLAALLSAAGESALAVFGAMDMETRKGNLEAFRSRAARVLVVTDVAARGLDIPLLDNVINYDFPDKAKLFVHRVGRVARGGHKGAAFSLATAADLPYMLDFLLFLGRPVSNVFQRDAPAARVDAEEDAEGGASGSEGEGEGGGGGGGARAARAPQRAAAAAAASVGGASVASGADGGLRGAARSVGGGTAVTNAVRYDEGEGYTLAEMGCEHVHYGHLPRAPLELCVEAVRALTASHIEIRNLGRSAANALELYHRTRAAASRRSSERARALEDDRVHPLFVGAQGAGEAAAAAYVAGLAAFRPPQTILEVEGGAGAGQGGRGGGGGGGKKARGAKNRAAALMAAKRAQHGAVIHPRVGAVSLGAAVLAAAKGSGALEEGGVSAALAGEMAGVAASMGERVEDMVSRHRERQAVGARRAAAAAAAGAAALAARGGGSDGSDGSDGDGEGDSSDGSEGGGGGGSLADTLLSTSAPAGRQRLSAAARRRARGGGGAPAAAGAPAAPAGALQKSERRKRLRETEGGGAAAAALFRDAKHFVSLRPASEVVAEAGFSRAGTLGGALGEGGGGAGGGGGGLQGASDLADLQRLEDGALELLGDEKAHGMGRGGAAKRRVRYWDPVKKRYLMLDASEIGASGRRKISAVKNESGARVGKKGKLADGELYKAWAARGRRGGGGEEEEGGGGVYSGSGGGGEGAAGGGVVDFGETEAEAVAGEGGRGGKGGKGAAGGKGGAAGGKGGKGGAGAGGAPGGRGGALRSAAEIAKERARKDKGRGKFGKKLKRKPGEVKLKLGHSGKIKRGGGIAPGRSKLLVKGKGISGFKTAGRAGRGGGGGGGAPRRCGGGRGPPPPRNAWRGREGEGSGLGGVNKQGAGKSLTV